MKLETVVRELKLKVLAGKDLLEREVTGGYASDMLSDVLANSREGSVWITMQTHANVLAVASAKDLAAIIIVNDRKPDAETLTKAEQKKIPILMSQWSTYTVVGRLYTLGLSKA